MKDWRDIKVGETYRLRNIEGKELDRTIVSADAKRVVYQRAEAEEGKLSDIESSRFVTLYNQWGIPYDPQFSGDRTAAFIDPDFEFDDEEEGQLTLF